MESDRYYRANAANFIGSKKQIIHRATEITNGNDKKQAAFVYSQQRSAYLVSEYEANYLTGTYP
jgi:hypothetical protein